MNQRIVAVAASAGGVEALSAFLAQLPRDLPATVLVGLHLSRNGRSMLPRILARHSSLPVVAAQAGAPLVPGTVVVTLPNHHLLVEDGKIVLGHGARENGHRPAHDAMLRSVALAAGPAAVGVVLTGLLDDGAAGLRCIQRYGGACFVQDPDEADYPSMPRAALEAVPGAQQALLITLAKEVARTVNEPPHAAPVVPIEVRRLDEAELASATAVSTRLSHGEVPGVPSPFSCPDCEGVLSLIPDDRVLRFRCRTGHAWTAQSLIEQQGEAIETALWVALRALEESRDLNTRLAERAARDGRSASLEHHRVREAEEAQAVDLIRGLIRSSLTDSPDELPG